MFFRQHTPTPTPDATPDANADADAVQATPVTGLLGLLADLPAEMAGHVLVVVVDTDAHGRAPDRHLAIAVTTRRAGQVLADALGLTCPPTTVDTETSWTGTTPHGHVMLLQDDTWDDDHTRDPQALAGHLTRLDQALRADPAAATHLADGTATATATPSRLRVHARTTPAARALAALLCPDATRQPLTITSPRTPYWQATTPDTTITGPWAHTHRPDTDTDEDLP